MKHLFMNARAAQGALHGDLLKCLEEVLITQETVESAGQ